MGRPRGLRLSRTALASALVAVAVALPIVTWLIAGGRLVAREAELERASVTTHAYKKGLKLANRVANRLAEVRASEEDRSFSTYQSLHHDPQSVAEGAAVTVSPLARGPVSSDILHHFQVDEDGRLTLPTVNDQIPELGLITSENCTALEALQDVALYASSGISKDDVCPLADRSLPPALFDPDGAMAIHHVEELDPDAWKQHLEANALYRDIKLHGAKTQATRRWSGAADDDARVYILVGPFQWFTLPVANQTEMVALRAVETPEGTWTQGFVIARDSLVRLLDNDEYPASLVPVATMPQRADASEGGRSQVQVPVEGTAWAIALDAGPALAEVAALAARERSGFLRIVLLCAAAAGLAGIMVVALVHQTERLASQRAQFAASAAHELRTPLASLRLYGEMLADGLGDPARARQYASRLAGEAERLGRVVSNVLSFTRLERSMLRVDAHEGDLGARVREVMERLTPTLETAGVVVELAIDDAPGVIFDRDAIGHIVQNLVDNAEKYTRDVEDRRVRIAVARSDDGVDLSVSDNGPGVSRAARRRLFKPFVRGENTGAAEGLGLGLVLVQALAQAQRATVRYHDAAGGGARFVVRFPAARADVA